MGPAELLEGKTLQHKWKVVKKLKPSHTATGGHFSTGYIIEDSFGKSAFLKAMDYEGAFKEADHLKALNRLTNGYLFEKNICKKCTNARLSRVVHAVESFTVQIDPANPFSKVECLVFELADGDIRAHLSAAAVFDLAFVLRAIHNVATAIDQLHKNQIAHQDLKPSNVLVFGEDVGSKVGDFGRAWSKDLRVAHDNYTIPGDGGYAAPELLYNYVPADENARRYGCDIYLLGSLMVYLVTSVSMSGLIINHLHHSHFPRTWPGSYLTVLPYVQAAFGLALTDFRAALPDEIRQDLSESVSYLCQPDPGRRGHPQNRIGHSNQFGLERFVSRFDLLARRAEINLTNGTI